MKTLEFVGPVGAGKKTIAGQLLYQLNGVDLETLKVLETKCSAKYEKILPMLLELHKTPSFHTPSFEVTILDSLPENKTADSIVLVLSPDTLNDDFNLPPTKLTNRAFITILNKIDSIPLSEEAFLQFKNAALEKLKSLGINMDQAPIVPVSGLTGDNVVITPETEPWTRLNGEKLSFVRYLDRALAS